MLTQELVNEFAKVWYQKLDIHAPEVEFLPMLADEELEMVFPEATVKGWVGFEGWLQRVIRIFFDEVHTLKEVKTTINGDYADVKVVVQWEASVWNPPSAKSQRIVLDAYQTWVVKYEDGVVKITKYIVDTIKYHECSATL